MRDQLGVEPASGKEQEMVEFEFHISPALSSSPTHTGVPRGRGAASPVFEARREPFEDPSLQSDATAVGAER